MPELERLVLATSDPEGVVLRYGSLYGPQTTFSKDGAIADLVRKRQFPLVAGGSSVFSFVHLDDAATATVSALENGPPGIYNVVDDDPAPIREWLPHYAEVLGTPRPRKAPRFLARMMAGTYGLYVMTDQRGASNAKAKGQLNWSLRFSKWRKGFQTALG